MTRFTALTLSLGLLAAAPGFAQDATEAAEAAPAPYAVKISVVEGNPDAHAGTFDDPDGMAEFFIYLDGAPARGAEFGISIEGGTLVAYVLDTQNPWVSLPVPDPYPGTIAQVKAGKDCLEPPILFGRMLVRPDTPGGKIALDVIPSQRATQAVVLHCDNTGTFGFRGHPAALNAEPAAAHDVAGIVESSRDAHDHADHAGHDH